MVDQGPIPLRSIVASKIMNAGTTVRPVEFAPTERLGEARRWLHAGLAVLLVLIGVAVVIAVAVPVLRGQVPSWQIGAEPWNWLIGLVGVVIAITIALAIVRVIILAAAGPYDWPAYRYHRRYWRQYGPVPDPALTVARERYARGEITREQYGQIVQDLFRPQS